MRYTRVDKQGNKLPQIEDTVTIQKIYDDDADLSYLDEPENADRKAAYERDDFVFFGVRVKIDRHDWLTGHTTTWQSSGLWGIESDSGEEYFQQVAQEQLAELQAEFPQLRELTLEGAQTKELGG